MSALKAATPPARATNYQATIAVDGSRAERIALALEEAPDPSPVAVGLFDLGGGRFEVVAYYEVAPRREALLVLIEAEGGEGLGPLRIEEVADADWVTLSQGQRGAVRAGRFLVYGGHDRGRVKPHRLAIEIDAGQAFGTAHHASTRGCLIALDDALKHARPRCVLDIGTGTGVLAIAAAKVLQAPALASDNDPLAVAIAADNARKNGVKPLVRVLKASGFGHHLLNRVKPDLVLANLLERPLHDLAPAMSQHIAQRGTAILSGITQTQARGIEARYSAFGFSLKRRIILDGWTTLVITRRSAQVLRD
jgi:ribosomal protein L11 methyltransferase